jgi:hypothetical protein
MQANDAIANARLLEPSEAFHGGHLAGRGTPRSAGDCEWTTTGSGCAGPRSTRKKPRFLQRQSVEIRPGERAVPSVKCEGVRWGRIERGSPFEGCPSLDPADPLPHPAVQGCHVRAREDANNPYPGCQSPWRGFLELIVTPQVSRQTGIWRCPRSVRPLSWTCCQPLFGAFGEKSADSADRPHPPKEIDACVAPFGASCALPPVATMLEVNPLFSRACVSLGA